MFIASGLENNDGEFRTQVIGESKPNETPREAITRIAECFLHRRLGRPTDRWIDKWSRLGPCNTPTEVLPALFVRNRIFMIATKAELIDGVWHEVLLQNGLPC